MSVKYNSAPPHDVATREQWLAKGIVLLAKEKELTRIRDEVAAERRALPWVKVEKNYVFEAPDGPKALAELFDGQGQLAIYHFMLAPGSDHVCPGCSFVSDHVDAARQHFEQAGLAFAAVSRAPLSRIKEVKRRMGWSFPWVSSNTSDFNFDYGVSFDGRAGQTYNYAATDAKGELHGTSIFAKDEAGAVYHTYSAYARGVEIVLGAFNWLDLTPKGRNEDGIMSWLKLHDQYGALEDDRV